MKRGAFVEKENLSYGIYCPGNKPIGYNKSLVVIDGDKPINLSSTLVAFEATGFIEDKIFCYGIIYETSTRMAKIKANDKFEKLLADKKIKLDPDKHKIVVIVSGVATNDKKRASSRLRLVQND